MHFLIAVWLSSRVKNKVKRGDRWTIPDTGSIFLIPGTTGTRVALPALLILKWFYVSFDISVCRMKPERYRNLKSKVPIAFKLMALVFP